MTLSHRIRLADLPPKGAPVEIVPDAEALAAMAARLDVSALRKVRLAGRMAPDGAGWRLEARLGATVVQPCGVTLDPVTTRVEEPVLRRWLPGVPEGVVDDEGAVEMPEDDTVEPLADVVDAGAVLEEALSLAIPAFPRAEGADALDMVAGPPGVAPLTDEAARPFAGLAALKARMEDEG